MQLVPSQNYTAPLCKQQHKTQDVNNFYHFYYMNYLYQYSIHSMHISRDTHCTLKDGKRTKSEYSIGKNNYYSTTYSHKKIYKISNFVYIFGKWVVKFSHKHK